MKKLATNALIVIGSIIASVQLSDIVRAQSGSSAQTSLQACDNALAQYPYEGQPIYGHSNTGSGLSATGGMALVGAVAGPTVPQGEAWLLYSADIFASTVPASNAEFMLEILDPVPEQGFPATCEGPNGAHCWGHGIAKQIGAQATPLLALGRSFAMLPGQTIIARSNVALTNWGLGTMYYRFPSICAASLTLAVR